MHSKKNRLCACTGSLELLAARSLALLRSLTDYERATFLDQACSRPTTHAKAQAVASQATFLAGASVPSTAHLASWRHLLSALLHRSGKELASAGQSFTLGAL